MADWIASAQAPKPMFVCLLAFDCGGRSAARKAKACASLLAKARTSAAALAPARPDLAFRPYAGPNLNRQKANQNRRPQPPDSPRKVRP